MIEKIAGRIERLRTSVFVAVLICLVFTDFKTCRAEHLLGGEITWACQSNGQYIFQLKLFRDCNEPVVNITGMKLAVWNHPSITSIPVNFISSTDISPTCTASGGAQPVDCSTKGKGAVEEYLFQSDPLNLPGVPGTDGWVFTWTKVYRNSTISNIQAGGVGMTLKAVMYAYNGQDANTCYDSSPQFYEIPSTVICQGKPFTFNHNVFDSDLDSLIYSWAQPLADLVSTYNPPTDPKLVQWQNGFSTDSPMPGTAFNPDNKGANLDKESGEITFKCFNEGIYVLVLKLESFRDGVLIAENYRELQVFVVPCLGNNNIPQIEPPFIENGVKTFYREVQAGDLVNFDVNVTDAEFLQDGTTPQAVTIDLAGPNYGNGFTDENIGCAIAPCATVTQSIPFSGAQAAQVSVKWKTSCNHLSASGNADFRDYNFVIRAQDDFCPAPGVAYATVRIRVKSLATVAAPTINCANVLSNGDVELSWNPATNTGNSFASYELYVSSGGSYTLLTSIKDINITSYSHLAANGNNTSLKYKLTVKSGCSGAIESTPGNEISTMLLNVSDPNDGTAVLQWNALHAPSNLASAGGYILFREYPLGTWSAIDTLTYGTNIYVDTITICDDTLNYKIKVDNSSGCSSESSIGGGRFKDVIGPSAPIISSISVDSISGLANITWSATEEDTKGYILMKNIGGQWVRIDTVYGINNTTYEYFGSLASDENETYALSAFDTCVTGNFGSTNTSIIGDGHTSIYAEGSIDTCNRSAYIHWSPYEGWKNGVERYDILVANDGKNYSYVGSADRSSYTYEHNGLLTGKEYCYIVRAIEKGGTAWANSNPTCFLMLAPELPKVFYLQTATVAGKDQVGVRIFQDQLQGNGLDYYQIARSPGLVEDFEIVGIVSGVSSPLSFIDDVDVSARPYYYKAYLVDRCGEIGDSTNFGTTIHATIIPKVESHSYFNLVQWTPYQGWAGNVQGYDVYRSINGVFEANPIAQLGPDQTSLIDDVTSFVKGEINESAFADGKFCYYIEGNESTNVHGINEISRSNTVCTSHAPIVFIPNAIVIDGANPVFNPVISYFDISTDYHFAIFNRWGQRVWETSDPFEGWDGKLKGGKSGGDAVYIYSLKFRDGSGKIHEFDGPVTVLQAP